MWLKISFSLIFVCLIFFGVGFFRSHLKISPAFGGQYIEGLVGAPKYINPLYNYKRDVDSDLSSLIFSSLFKRDAKGALINDLAKSWSLSDDGKVYTITLRNDAYFSNGDKLTVDDVIFTINAMADPNYSSPWHSVFSGVDVERVDDQTIKLTLSEAYAAFPEMLTFGILPHNLWQNIDPTTANLADLNLKPIGSGPYKFDSLTKNKNGEIKEYSLVANQNYYEDGPYIQTIFFKFYSDIVGAVAALNDNSIDALGNIPHGSEKDVLAKNSFNVQRLNFDKVYGIFINQKNNPNLSDKAVRQALAVALDKNKIVTDTFGDSAVVANGPILTSSPFFNDKINKYEYNFAAAEKILSDSGWKKITINESEVSEIGALTPEQTKKDENLSLKKELFDYASSSQISLAGTWLFKSTKKGVQTPFLSVTLTAINSEDGLKLANAVKNSWEALGVKVKINPVAVEDLQSNIIATRNFEAFIFGQAIGNDPDQYAFWHSSQIGNGGLNISEYKNKDVDTLLEAGRLATSTDVRIAKYQKFQEIITNEIPMIFLYSPRYLYLQNKKINGLKSETIVNFNDRFSNISQWYINTKKKLTW
ncbi:MAG: ABC transporter substrate-binding protein [Candidatus Falkowbacteria bacterium]